MIDRQAMNKPQRSLLDVLVYIVRQYEDTFCRCPNSRHSRTTIIFEGDRYKIAGFEIKWRRTRTTLNQIGYETDE